VDGPEGAGRPVGAVLAGGAGRRLIDRARGVADTAPAASKASVPLAGRRLVSYPIAAVAQVCESVAVVCKRSTVLPSLERVERWEEPDEPQHPAAGIAAALEIAQAPVLICGGDMPFVTPEACQELVTAARRATGEAGMRAPVVAAADGGLEPLLAVYPLPAQQALRDAARRGDSLRAAVAALGPVRVSLPGALLRSVNTPADLEQAERDLAARV
jgi:molybdopterin-guanine dinucleotide biosynthesis protein A